MICVSPGYRFPPTYMGSVLCVPAHMYHWTVYIKATARAHDPTFQNLIFDVFQIIGRDFNCFSPVIALFN